MGEKDIVASRKAAADLIERVANDEISADKAIVEWPDLVDDDIELALRALMHFRDDTIGDHDKYHANSHVGQLKEIAQALLSDSSVISQETRSQLRPWRFW